MNRLIAPFTFLACRAVIPVQAQDRPMRIEVSDLQSRPDYVGPTEYFTGTAVIEPLFSSRDEARAGAARVTFVPGARTVWHSHPRGQTLVVTSGRGWVQERGGERHEIKAGDVVWTPPGVEHWHGATPEHALSHVAIQEAQDGSVVNWMEPVSDEEYQEHQQ